MTLKVRTLGDLSQTFSTSEGKTIVKETDETFYSFILKTNSKDLVFTLDIDGVVKYRFSIEDMYDYGLTRFMRWMPWLQTYDPTNDIYVVVFEPVNPIDFSSLKLTMTPSGNTEYSYLMVLSNPQST